MRTLLVLLACVLAAPHARAAPCSDLPNPIYLQIGDTQTNLIKRLARALRDNSLRKMSLVFKRTGSCVNIAAIYNGTKIPEGEKLYYIPSMSESASWIPSTSIEDFTCTAPTGGVVPDVANSALFNSACTTNAPPATVNLTQGPVQAYVMAVPEASSQTAITFEEAYFVFGFGMAGMIQPWTIEAQMFIRTVTKSTLLAWAANISVPADKWKGVKHDLSDSVVSDLKTSTTPENAIGILGAEVYDGLRDDLNVLAFRARGQYAAYYPDSTATSRDKKNVRDGHYTVWSPTIWMDTTDGNGNPIKADARYLIDLIAGKTVSPQPQFDVISIIQTVGLVPDCAMGVTRDFEGGPLRLYSPAESCVCKYESLADSSSCATCSTMVPCTTGVCRNGYCEAQ